jgi:hypothetical protein
MSIIHEPIPISLTSLEIETPTNVNIDTVIDISKEEENEESFLKLINGYTSLYHTSGARSSKKVDHFHNYIEKNLNNYFEKNNYI